MLATAIIALRRDLPRADAWPALSELWAAFVPAAPALFAPVVLIGGMLSGSFTPTEASAVAVVYVLVVGVFYYREMTWGFISRRRPGDRSQHRRDPVHRRLRRDVRLDPGGRADAPDRGDWFKGISADPLVLLLIVNVIFFIAGMFVDSTTATLLLVPIIAPPMMAVGVDPVHLGIVVIFNLMLGTVTPPIGLSLFLLANMTGVPFTRLLRAMVPFYPPLLITLLLLTFFPEVSLMIPKLFR